MRLADTVEASGFFWLPEDDTRKVPGRLTISSTGRTELVLTALTEFQHVDDPGGVLGERAISGEPVYYRRIVGLVNSDKVKDYITLEDCHRLNSETTLGTGLSTTIIEAMIAFVGVAYSSDDTIEFSELRFSVSALDEWLSISGVGISPEFNQNNKLNSVTIQYTPPAKRTYSLPDNMTLEFNFDATVPIVPRSTETSISQRARISIRTISARPLDEFIELIFKIQNMLNFCIDAMVPLDFVEGYSDQVVQELTNGKHRRIPVKIYYRGIPEVEAISNIRRHNMLLTYGLIEHRFEDVLNRWLVAYNQCRPTFDLYFRKRIGAFKYIEGEFLSLVQAMESFHRRQTQYEEWSKKELPTDEFNEIKDAMLATVPLERKGYFESKLRHFNEPSLRKRLKEMFEPYWSPYKIDKKRKDTVERIVNARHYLTHYSEDRKVSPANGQELLKLNDLMESLLQLHLLNLLGVEQTMVKDIASKNLQLRWKLGARN